LAGKLGKTEGDCACQREALSFTEEALI